MDMVLDTVDTDMAMDLDTMAIMDLDTTDTARGLLMLSLRPRLILTTDMDIMVSDTDMGSDMDTMVAISDTATVCTAMESKSFNNLSANQQLQLRQKWIVIILKFPSPVLQFQCYHTKSL